MNYLYSAIAVLILIALIWWLDHRRNRTSRGMKQFARDPSAMEAAAEALMANRERLANAPFMSDAEIDSLVESILSEEAHDRTRLAYALQKAGPHAKTRLIQALSDPRCDPAEEPESEWSPDQTRFEAVTRTLAAFGAPQIIPALCPWAEGAVERQRRHAALCIAATGAAEAIEPTRRLLRSPDKDDRCYAAMGISWAVKYDLITPAYHEAIFAELAGTIRGEKGFGDLDDEKAVRALVELEPGQAIELLSSPQVLNIDNPLLIGVLNQLNEAGATVPLAVLAPILDRAKREPSILRWKRAYAESLRAMARTDPARGREDANAALAVSDERVRRAAVDALRLGAALPTTYDLWNSEATPFEELPRPVQHIVAIGTLDMEVRNGGFSQYLFNSSGDQLKLAIEGLREMNAARTLALLDDLIRFVGPAGASPNRRKRIKAYAKLSDEKEKFLDTLSSSFYEDPDHLDLCILRYMEKHAPTMHAAAQRAGKATP